MPILLLLCHSDPRYHQKLLSCLSTFGVGFPLFLLSDPIHRIQHQLLDMKVIKDYSRSWETKVNGRTVYFGHIHTDFPNTPAITAA
jgi:hypothetical protein